MYVEDLKKEFLDVLLQSATVVVVEPTVDAACAWWSLRALLRGAGAAHSAAAGGGLRAAAAALAAAPGARAALLVGLGARDDLVAALRPPAHLTLFVLDAARPAHVCNVYSDAQVRLLHRDVDDQVPDFDDIFRDDDDDDDEDGDHQQESSGEGGSRAELAERQRARAAWERRRHDLLLAYTQRSYYAAPVGVVAGELCARLGAGGAGAAWAASVAAAAGRVSAQRTHAAYLLDAERALRLAGVAAGAELQLVEDAWLPLARRWSVWDALGAALPGAPRAALLADMGLPLAAARQAYSALDVELRARLAAALRAALLRRRPGCVPALLAPALLLRRRCAPAQAAHDLVYTMLGLLHHPALGGQEALSLALTSLEPGAAGAAARAQGELAAKCALAAIADTLRRVPAVRRPPFLHVHVAGGGGAGAEWAARGGWLREAAARLAAGAGGRAGALLTAEVGGGVLLQALPPDAATAPPAALAAALEQAAADAGLPAERPTADPLLLRLPAAAAPAALAALAALLH